jgi:hypothetical protein
MVANYNTVFLPVWYFNEKSRVEVFLESFLFCQQGVGVGWKNSEEI